MYGRNNEKCSHRDHYDTKQDAKRAAQQMGMDGCHSMSCNGKTVYMPGKNHSEYMDYNEGGMGGVMGGDIPGL